MTESHHGNEMNRREFLRLSALASAALLASSGVSRAGAEPASVAAPAFAAFHPLPPGAVEPEGWLRLYLQKQAANLGSQLPNVSWPFTEPFWQGAETGESWWPWEQKAYWVDGATRLGLVLKDQKLLDQVQATLRYTLDHADQDGYLGPQFFKNPTPDFDSKALTDDFHRWPHTIFFRGVAASFDAGQNADALEALRKHYLNDQTSYGRPVRNVTNVENMLWVYERTGDKRLLELAEKSWMEYARLTGPGGDRGDLSPLRVFAATPIDGHGVTYIETAKQPALLYLYTGNQDYLRFAQAAQRRIFDHHMLIDGIPSTSEFYRTRTSLDSHETCDITDHTWSWGYMLMATGDGIWADRVERACLNAGMGAIKKDWKALQYFSCPNQFLATLNSDHNVMEHGGHMMAFQPNPGKHTACCGGDVHRLFPNYAIRMWMKDQQGGLAAMLYGPSRLKTTVGARNQHVEIEQETSYPFEEQIRLTVKTAEPVEFPLSLRIPAWAAGARVEVNGKRADVAVQKGFVTLRRSFKQGDRVVLTLPMRAAVTEWPQNGIGVEHGPLVYALAIREQWTPVVEPRYTTPEYPSWNAMPASAWNLGLATEFSHAEQDLKFNRGPMTADPWVDPPVSLTVPARTIAEWKLQQNPDNPAQQFTPALPENDASTLGDLEQIKLVPYGSTHLRLTIFPKIKG